MRLQDKRIVVKLGVVIALFSILLIACSAVTLFGLRTNDLTVRSVLGQEERSLYQAGIAAETKTHLRGLSFELALASDQAERASVQGTFVKEVGNLRQSLAPLKPLLAGDELVQFNKIVEASNTYAALEAKAVDLLSAGDTKGFDALLRHDMSAAFEDMDRAFDALLTALDQGMRDAAAPIAASSANTLWTTVILSAAGLAFTIAVSIWLIKTQVTSPLGRLTAAMGSLAAGDTSIEVTGQDRKDEIGALAKALETFRRGAIEKSGLETRMGETRNATEAERVRNEAHQAEASAEQAHVVTSIGEGLQHLTDGRLTFRIGQSFGSTYEALRLNFNGAMDKLQGTMTTVSANTAAIRSGTDEISSAADDLSRRTEQQAASLEETAAALDEITATVKKTAEGSTHARQVVGTAKKDAEHSGEVVRQAIQAMSGIEKSSTEIGQIIGVIDEIAFQTNLLALNAGVEAARAGDAGRGFAVVASEVRALAQRSAEAAKEIKTLISTSTHQVSQGVDLVGNTGKALERIVVQVTEINGIVADIAASAQEQATALDEVNSAVNQMDQMTQQNAAMVEQSTAASHSLKQETEELSRLIGGFEIGEAAAVGTSARTSGRAARAAKPRTVTALRTVGSGGAVRKAETQSDWQEF